MRPKIWSMLPFASIRRHRPLVLLEVVEHRRGLGVVLAQAIADDRLGVVAALDERAAAAIADAGDPRRLGDDVIARLAALAGAAARDAHDQLLVGGVEHQDVVELLAVLAQHARRAPRPAGRCAEIRRAGSRARCPAAPSRSAMRSSTSSIGDQLALVDELLGALAERRVRLDGRPQHVAGRDVRDLEDLRTAVTPASPSRARGSEQQKVLTQSPGRCSDSLAADGARARGRRGRGCAVRVVR